MRGSDPVGEVREGFLEEVVVEHRCEGRAEVN